MANTQLMLLIPLYPMLAKQWDLLYCLSAIVKWLFVAVEFGDACLTDNINQTRC